MPTTFVIVPIGLDAQDRLVVNTVAKLLSHEGIAYQIQDGQPGKAHLFILDEDSSEGRQALKQSRPGQVKLVVSNKPASAKNTIGIPRPIDLGFLKAVLKKLHATLLSQVPAQLSLDTAQQYQAAGTLTGTLFNILLDAGAKQEILHLRSEHLPDFFIDGHNHCLATTATEAEISQLITTPVDTFSISRLNPESFAVHSNDMSIQSLYNLLWLVGIRCSDGRLLSGHKLDMRFRLRAWPNFTRHGFIASHFKLAALLARQAMTINQLAEQTQVPLNEVINFYNAAYAVELIEYQSESDEEPDSASPRNLAKQGLLAKIARRLNLKSIF